MKKKWILALVALLLAFGCKKETTTSYTVFYKVSSTNSNITGIRFMNADGSLTTVNAVDTNKWVSPSFSANQGAGLALYAYCKNTADTNPTVSVFIYFSDNSCPTCGEYVHSDSIRVHKIKFVSDSIVNYILPH